MQNANSRQFDVLFLRRYTHKRLAQSPCNRVSSHQSVALTDQILKKHLCIRKESPETVVKLLYAFQPWLDPLIAMQDYLVRIKLEIFLSRVRIGEALDGMQKAVTVGHADSLIARRDLRFQVSSHADSSLFGIWSTYR
jgi:hypothetical protein